jgi:metal-responsive CopG/Arc/MetJ family transcriptional regulator
LTKYVHSGILVLSKVKEVQKMGRKKVTISLDEEVLTNLDEQAKKVGFNRSSYITALVNQGKILSERA